MKKIFLFCLVSAFSLQIHAVPAVQRTPNSSYKDFQTYLKKTGYSNFVDAYIQISSVTELETPLLEKCLEEIYLGAPAASTCLTAVKSLTSKPLNQSRREVLYSFLLKLEKVQSPQRDFYHDLKSGLLRTHSHLAKTFGAQALSSEDKQSGIQDLEMNAWRKALTRKFPLEEVALLINGKRISKLEKWSAPRGAYQWSLVTNTHEPFVRLGTFSQFASESLKELKPLASASCKDVSEVDVQKFGLLQLEVFATTKCIAQFGMSSIAAKSEPSGPSGHLGKSANMVQMESSSSRHWIWPVLAFVTVGIAASLKDKQVSLQMPGTH